MLYLIKDRDYLKIGYTQDINNRGKNYELHNCYAELLYTKNGSRLDEKEIHKLCNKYSYKGEGYHNCDEVINIFVNFKSQIIKDIIGFKSIVTNNAVNILSNNTNFLNKQKIKAKQFLNSIASYPELIIEYNLKIWINYYKEQIGYLDTISLLKSDFVHYSCLYRNEYFIFFNKSVKITNSHQCKNFINNIHDKYYKKQLYTDKAINLIEQIEQLLQLEHTQERYNTMVSLLEQAKELNELVKQIYIPEETVHAFDILLEGSQMKFSREL